MVDHVPFKHRVACSSPARLTSAKPRKEPGLHTPASTRNAETIKRLTELLIAAAKPKLIIMFGSEARGDAGEDSDLDVMVVEEGVSDRAGEMVRLATEGEVLYEAA